MEEQKIVKTDTLRVQIFHMPVIDLSVRFCYCFVEPIPMIWQTDGRVSVALNLKSDNGNDWICKFLLNKYREIIENSKRQGLWHQDLAWLDDVDKVQVVQCDLTPKNEFSFTSLLNKG